MANRFDQMLNKTVRGPNVAPVIVVGGGTSPDNAGAAVPGPLVGRAKFLCASGGMVTGGTGMLGVSLARSSTGGYSLSFPAVASLSDMTISVSVKPAASGAWFGSWQPGGSIYSGTANIAVAPAGGVGLNLTAGDEIHVFFYVDPSTLEGVVP